MECRVGDARRRLLARLAIDPRAVLKSVGRQRGIHDDAENAIVLMLDGDGLGPVLATLTAREGTAVRYLDTTLVVELADRDIGLGATALLYHLDLGRAVGQPGAEEDAPHPAPDRPSSHSGLSPRGPQVPHSAPVCWKNRFQWFLSRLVNWLVSTCTPHASSSSGRRSTHGLRQNSSSPVSRTLFQMARSALARSRRRPSPCCRRRGPGARSERGGGREALLAAGADAGEGRGEVGEALEVVHRARKSSTCLMIAREPAARGA